MDNKKRSYNEIFKMEDTKFKMSVSLDKNHNMTYGDYGIVKSIVKHMKPSDSKDRYWLNNCMERMLEYDHPQVTLEGTKEQFFDLMKYQIKIQGLFKLPEHLFVM